MRFIDFIKKNRLYIAMTGVFLVMLLLNSLTPIIYDDFNNSSCKNLKDVFNAANDIYNTWTGRYISSLGVFLFMMLPKWIFNICNSVIYTLLLYFVCDLSSKDKTVKLLSFVIFACLLWMYLPLFGESIFWATGAIVYLWSSFAVIAVIYIYSKRIFPETGKSTEAPAVWKSGLFFILAFVAGNGMENTSGGLILFIFVLLAYFVYKKRKTTVFDMAGLFGALAGFAVMILSPGSAARSSAASAYLTESSILSVKFLNRFITCTENLAEYKWLVIIWFALLVMGFVARRKDKRNLISLLLGFCGLAVNYALILSPQAPLRACSGAVIFIASGAVCSAGVIAEDGSAMKKIIVGFAGALFILSTYNFVYALPDLMLSKIENNMRYEYISSQLSYGNTNIIVPELRASYSQYNIQNESLDYIYRDRADNKSIPNRFKGVNSIIAVPKNDWTNLYSMCDLDLLDGIELNAYCDTLSEKNYITLVVVNKSLPEGGAAALSGLGLSPDNYDLSGGNYAAVLYGREILFEGTLSEGSSQLPLSALGIEKADITLLFGQNGGADVLVNGLIRSYNYEGINFLVFDKDNGVIADRVSFKTEYSGAYR